MMTGQYSHEGGVVQLICSGSLTIVQASLVASETLNGVNVSGYLAFHTGMLN